MTSDFWDDYIMGCASHLVNGLYPHVFSWNIILNGLYMNMYIYIYIYGLITLTNWDAQCRIDSRKLSHLLSGVRSTHGFLEDLEVWWDARLQATHLGK